MDRKCTVEASEPTTPRLKGLTPQPLVNTWAEREIVITVTTEMITVAAVVAEIIEEVETMDEEETMGEPLIVTDTITTIADLTLEVDREADPLVVTTMIGDRCNSFIRSLLCFEVKLADEILAPPLFL